MGIPAILFARFGRVRFFISLGLHIAGQWLKDAKFVLLTPKFNEKRQAELPTCPDCGWFT